MPYETPQIPSLLADGAGTFPMGLQSKEWVMKAVQCFVCTIFPDRSCNAHDDLYASFRQGF